MGVDVGAEAPAESSKYQQQVQILRVHRAFLVSMPVASAPLSAILDPTP